MYKATDKGNVLMTEEEVKDVVNTQAYYKSDEHKASKLEAKKKVLRQAAIDYEINGFSNIGITVLTLGVMQGKPKALAVYNWALALWEEHSKRASLVSLDTTPDLDFSSMGKAPYSVVDLKEELDVMPSKIKAISKK